MHSRKKTFFCFLFVCIFFLSTTTNSVFAANKQFIEQVRKDYVNFEAVFSKGYESYENSTSKRYKNYQVKQTKALERFISQTKQDEQRLIQALNKDVEQLEKQYAGTDKLRDYKNKVNPNYLGSPMQKYSQSINPNYLNSFMMQYKNAVNENYLNSAMMKYKNAVNQHYLNSPMMKYKNAVNQHYLNSPMMKLKNGSNQHYTNSIMYKYSRGQISQSEANKQWQSLRKTQKELLQQVINQSKASIKQLEGASEEAILMQQTKTVNGILSQRADTIGTISKLRAEYFGEGISFNPLIPDVGEINVIVNGKWLGFQQPPKIERGTTLVPMRAIFEELGADVKWNQQTKGITATKGSTKVTLTLNQKTAKVNGKAVTLGIPPKAINGHTLVPLRFVSESLGADVKWDGKNQTVFITH